MQSTKEKEIPSQPTTKQYKFGNSVIPNKLVFYEKNYVYAMVPLAPKLIGHIMIVPKRQVTNFKELAPAEVFDIGLAIRFLTKELEKFHGCTSSTVYIKNFSRTDYGTERINHMCVHVVSRRKGDINNNDDIYPTLERYDIDFSMEYNSTIANSDVFSDAKIEQFGLMASKYKGMVDKALQELKNPPQ